jgi:hypothetical protein
MAAAVFELHPVDICATSGHVLELELFHHHWFRHGVQALAVLRKAWARAAIMA